MTSVQFNSHFARLLFAALVLSSKTVHMQKIRETSAGPFKIRKLHFQHKTKGKILCALTEYHAIKAYWGVDV
jgi:hypothetical protein